MHGGREMSAAATIISSETSNYRTGAWDWAACSGPNGRPGDHGRRRAERVNERAAGCYGNCARTRTGCGTSNEECGPRDVGILSAVQAGGEQDIAGGCQRIFLTSRSCICTSVVANAGELAARTGPQDVPSVGCGDRGLFVSRGELVLAGAEAGIIRASFLIDPIVN